MAQAAPGYPVHEVITPDLAKAMKQDQGHLEMEVWPEGEEGSHAWDTCLKNPGHEGFTPAPDFHADLLPPPYHGDPEVLELVRAQAELTVRLRVGYKSSARPEGYAFSKFKGRRYPHTGSGVVLDVVLREAPATSGTSSAGLCPCVECVDAPPPRLAWWEVSVRTAKHVVFDTEEARATVADLDLDKPGQVRSNVCLHGIRQVTSHEDGDISKIVLATHDEAVGQRLSQTTRHYRNLYVNLARYPRDPARFPLYAVITSHPHGYSKQISVGRRLERWVVTRKVEGAQLNEEWTEYVYETPTCAGSSGAPVLLLGKEAMSGRQWVDTRHVHRQKLTSNLGHSSIMLECFKNTEEPVSQESRSLPI